MRTHRYRSSILALLALVGVAPTRAAVSIYMSPEQLAERSSRIVEGTVASVASGHDPATGSLATYITLEVSTVHRGPRDGDGTLVLREPGGSFGDLVHEVDAVPVYRPGERVFVYLEAAPDGALRTAGMFYGKYMLADKSAGGSAAVRDLAGGGRILGRSAGPEEILPVADLAAVAAGIAGRQDRDAGRERPPEWERLEWDAAKFVPLSAAEPARWSEGAAGLPVVFGIERARNPLGDGAAAVAEVLAAMAAWTAVPESRVVLTAGDTDLRYTPSHPSSPAKAYPAQNVLLFGDPYDDIAAPDPLTCSGVLAVGGYWRSAESAGSANGVAFRRILRGYVIFNSGLDCYLGQPENLSEVAAHELGHTLGFGHSWESDALMRGAAWGFRGARLGDDDRDGAHCHYPHTIRVVAPAGGETLQSGSSAGITWTVSAEGGPDPGTVDIEISWDGGPWESIVSGTANDGHHAWPVPARSTTAARVRVARPNRGSGFGAPYPAACSADAADGTFSISVPLPAAGTLPSTLMLDKAAAGLVRLGWSASCSADVDDHAIYEGDLGTLRSGLWNAVPLTCSAGADLAEYVNPGAGDRFYLVAPLASGIEGGLGRASTGTVRPPFPAACGEREAVPACR